MLSKNLGQKTVKTKVREIQKHSGQNGLLHVIVVDQNPHNRDGAIKPFISNSACIMIQKQVIHEIKVPFIYHQEAVNLKRNQCKISRKFRKLWKCTEKRMIEAVKMSTNEQWSSWSLSGEVLERKGLSVCLPYCGVTSPQMVSTCACEYITNFAIRVY